MHHAIHFSRPGSTPSELRRSHGSRVSSGDGELRGVNEVISMRIFVPKADQPPLDDDFTDYV